MEKSKSQISMIVIDLLVKLFQIYIESSKKATFFRNKFSAIFNSVAGLLFRILVVFLFANALWLLLMSLLFIYLQYCNLTTTLAILILILINVILILSASFWFLSAKKRLSDLF